MTGVSLPLGSPRMEHYNGVRVEVTQKCEELSVTSHKDMVGATS